MKTVAVDEITEGMTLSSDVYQQDGKVLLGVGTELTERHRSLLGKRGIEMVSVDDEEEEVIESGPPAFLEEEEQPESAETIAVKTEIENVFAAHAENPLMMQLKELALGRADKIQL
jgi:hypothetical protein